MEQDTTPSGADALIGEMIDGRYRVDTLLGVGGMGTVFKCHHVSLDRDVAVKLLHPQLLENEQISARFDREAVSTSRLEHPNVLRVMDFGNWVRPDTGAKTKYMVLQFLVGQELSELCGEPMAPERVLELGLQVAKGLEHAHDRGVVHRDLKPENVFVTQDHDGRELLKILDFGLARMMSGSEDGERLTRHGMVFGTPHYMSPEQATGGDSDERTDIYALGIILWEMLAGRAPFDADDVVAILRMQVTLALPHEQLPPGTPPGLITLIDEMTQKSVADRMASASEVRQRLEALIEGQDDAREEGVEPAVASAREDSQPTSPASATAVDMLRGSFDSAMKLSIAQSERVGERLGVPAKVVMGAAAGFALILLTTLVMALSGDEDPQVAASQAPAVAAAPEEPSGWSLGLGTPKLDLSEIDAAMEAGSDATALLKIDALLREHPENARLNLRKGRLLAKQEGKRKAALEAFQTAVKADPDCLDDDEIRAALLVVFADPEVKDDAVEFALTRVKDGREEILLGLVNREEGVLSYMDRHRVISTLASEGDDGDVDRALNLNLDLWQAESTQSPCKDFETALEAVAEDPDEAHVGTLHYVRAPKAADDKERCAAVEDKRAALAEEFAEKYPEAAKNLTVPKDFEAKAKTRKKRRRRFKLFP